MQEKGGEKRKSMDEARLFCTSTDQKDNPFLSMATLPPRLGFHHCSVQKSDTQPGLKPNKDLQIQNNLYIHRKAQRIDSARNIKIPHPRGNKRIYCIFKLVHLVMCNQKHECVLGNKTLHVLVCKETQHKASTYHHSGTNKSPSRFHMTIQGVKVIFSGVFYKVF